MATPGLGPAASVWDATAASQVSPSETFPILQGLPPSSDFPQALESHIGVPLPSWLPTVFQYWSPSILLPREDAHLRPGLVLLLGGKFI